MRVPFFDMAAELASVRAEVNAAIARTLDSGVFIGGPEVTAFERELAAYANARHAVGTSSGTDALHMLAMALDIRPGDEVVTTPLTFLATAGSFARLGARIVFADIDDDTLCLDIHAAATLCSSRTRAVVTVNLFGYLAPIPTVPCPVIEDAAQSISTHGVRGVAATLSFFPTKNLGALGDAGAVLTNDPALADRLTLLRTQGARPKYHHLAIGGNFRLDPLQAAVLRAKLPYLERWTARRRAHAEQYRQLLNAASLPAEVRLPAESLTHVHHQFVIRVPRRDLLRAYLAETGIATEVYYPSPLHVQPCFADLGYRSGELPIAERACQEVLALPIHPALPEDAPAYIVDRIVDFYRGDTVRGP